MIRDRHKCKYCGSPDYLTIDHVTPKSRGGKDTFDNCVTSCKQCNNKKGSNTPREAYMNFIGKPPYEPTITEFIQIRMKVSGLDKILKELTSTY